MKILFIILLLFSNLYSIDLDRLSKSKTWLKLLHYHDGKSSIINSDFFLSSSGKNHPKDELKKTIEAFKNGKNICKYPARYIFLADKIHLNKSAVKECKDLQNWTLIKDTQDISVIFVSGFLGNPASAFGHSFMKMNKEVETTDLFDISISYGAKLPKNNNMILYIYNGTTGGYTASYSDKYYYMDDMVYSNQEYREMWEYKLNLTTYQKELLLYHLWELRGVDFNYYFFNRNCGYKLAELLDTVYQKPIIESAKVWYAPVETFYKLEEYGLVKKTIYHPSKQQNLYAFYNSFTDDEKDIVKDLLSDKDSSFTALDTLDSDTKTKILDFIISFQKYSKDKTDSKYLLKRMSLPISKYKDVKPPYKKPVTKGNKMSFISTGFQRIDDENYFSLGFSAFSLDKVGYNMLDGDMLSIFDVNIGLNYENAKLNRVDFIKIRRLKTQQIPYDKESPISWELRAGFEDIDGKDFVFDGAIGYSKRVFRYFKAYFMAHLITHSKDSSNLKPTLGLYANLDKLRYNLEVSKLYDKKSNLIDKNIYDIDVEYRYKEQRSIFVNMSNHDKKSYQLGLKWFF